MQKIRWALNYPDKVSYWYAWNCSLKRNNHVANIVDSWSPDTLASSSAMAVLALVLIFSTESFLNPKDVSGALLCEEGITHRRFHKALHYKKKEVIMKGFFSTEYRLGNDTDKTRTCHTRFHYKIWICNIPVFFLYWHFGFIICFIPQLKVYLWLLWGPFVYQCKSRLIKVCLHNFSMK